MGTRKLSVFHDALEVYSTKRGKRVQTWSAASTRTANLIQVGTSPNPIVLYVKDSTEEPGFWGMNGNQHLALEKNAAKHWFLILLVGAGEKGYCLPAELVVEKISRNEWSTSRADWKIHEPSEIAGADRFDSFEELFSLIFTD